MRERFARLFEGTSLRCTVKIALMSIVVGFAFCLSLGYEATSSEGAFGRVVESFGKSLNEGPLAFCSATLALFVLFVARKVLNEKLRGKRWPRVTVAVIWALAWTAGALFLAGDWSFDALRILKIVFCSTCYGWAFYAVACVAQALFPLFPKPRLQLPLAARGREFWWAWAAMVLLWLPYAICLYPGISAPNDTLDQLQQFFGVESFTSLMAGQIEPGVYLNNHHPVIYTFLLGAFVSVGLALGSANAGFFALAVVQALLLSASFAGIVKEMARRGIGVLGCGLATAFFGLVPCFPLYALCFTKDVLFTTLFVCCLLCIARLQDGIDSKAGRRGLCACLVGVVALMCLFRSTAVYLMAVVLLVSIVPLFRFQRKVAQSLIAGLVVALAISRALYPALGIAAGSSGEMLAVPYQQVAAVMAVDPSAVTEEEYAAVDAVLDADSLALRYNPTNVDPVKNERNFDSTDEEVRAFLSSWISIGMREPLAYGMALINLCSAYFCPNVELGYVWTYSFGWVDGGTLLFVDQAPDYWALGVNVFQGGLDDGGRDALEDYYLAFRNGPLGALGNMGVAFFFVVLCVGCLASWHVRNALPIATMVFLLACTLVLSPANGLLRYGLPIMASVPLLLAFVRQGATGYNMSCKARHGARDETSAVR